MSNNIEREDILQSRENMLPYLYKQITNLFYHISAKSLNQEVFATFGMIFEFYFSSERQIIKRFIVNESIFKKEKAELNFLLAEIAHIHNLWTSNTSIESDSSARLRLHQRGVATAVKNVNSQLISVMYK
jgi:hypothetical protein